MIKILRFLALYVLRIDAKFLELTNWRLAKHPEWITIILKKNVLTMDIIETFAKTTEGLLIYAEPNRYRVFHFIHKGKVFTTNNMNVTAKVNYYDTEFLKNPDLVYGGLKTNLIIRILKAEIKKLQKNRRYVISTGTHPQTQAGFR